MRRQRACRYRPRHGSHLLRRQCPGFLSSTLIVQRQAKVVELRELLKRSEVGAQAMQAPIYGGPIIVLIIAGGGARRQGVLARFRLRARPRLCHSRQQAAQVLWLHGPWGHARRALLARCRAGARDSLCVQHTRVPTGMVPQTLRPSMFKKRAGTQLDSFFPKTWTLLVTKLRTYLLSHYLVRHTWFLVSGLPSLRTFF